MKPLVITFKNTSPYKNKKKKKSISCGQEKITQNCQTMNRLVMTCTEVFIYSTTHTVST